MGYEAYLDWVYIDLAFTTDTNLQTVLDAFIAALPPGVGITLDATDYSGIPLAAFTWANMRASDGLRELCDRTGRIYRVSPLLVGSPASLEKVLAMPLPGGVAAPVTITDADPHCRELTWRDPATPPVTTIKLLCGTGTATKTATFLGTDRIDDPGGEYSYFYVPYNTPADLNGIWPNYLNIPRAGIGGPVLWGLNVGAHDWLLCWDYVNHRIVWDRTLGGDFDDAWAFDVFAYTAQYPFTVTATAGSPAPSLEIQELVTRADVFDYDQGAEIAEGLLAAKGASPRELEIVSLEHGWAPGQAVVVDLTGRDVNATCAVTEVEIVWVTGGFWEYRIKATELSVFPGSYLDQWRALLAGSSSGGGAVGSVSRRGVGDGQRFPELRARRVAVPRGAAAGGVAMSYALVQEQTAAAGVDPSDLDCTLDAPPVAGRLIVVRALWSPTERVATITDTAGNDYALAALVSEDIEEGSATLGIFYAYACLTATPFTVTATLEAPGDAITLAVSEWSGRSSAADPLGDTDTLAIPPTAPPAPPYDLTVGTVTPSAAGDLILGAIMEWSLDADPPGSTPLATEGFLSGFYLLAPSAAAYAAAVSFSSVPSPMLGAVVVFRLVDQVWVPVRRFRVAAHRRGALPERCRARDLRPLDGGSGIAAPDHHGAVSVAADDAGRRWAAGDRCRGRTQRHAADGGAG